jgi:hypothetical protein
MGAARGHAIRSMKLGSFLLGAVCGAAVTAVAGYAWQAHAGATSAIAPSTSSALPLSPTEPATPSAGAQAPSVERATPKPTDPESTPLPAAQVGVAAASSPKPTLASDPPIALSAEHAQVLGQAVRRDRPPSLGELHLQLSAETRDAAWSVPLEQSIQQYLQAANPSGEFEIMSVQCRATLCEVLAFGNLPTSGARWNQLWDVASSQPWMAGIGGNTTSTFVRNDRHVIVTVLQRSRKG